MAKPFVAVQAPRDGTAPLPGGRKRAGGAAVESLLAGAARVMDVSHADVIETCEALGVDSPSRLQKELKSLYHRYLDHCFGDRKLSIEQSEDLEHLQSILELSDADVADVQDEVAISVYGSAVAEVLEDLRIDSGEAAFLARLREELQLPEWKAERILEDGQSEARARALDQAMAMSPGGLLQGLPGVPARQYVKILLPMTIVLLLGFFLEYRARVGTDRARLLAAETAEIQSAVGRVESGLAIATGDLDFVVDLVADAIDDDTLERLEALGRSARAFLRHRTSYFQIRFIGATGQEILRVESTSTGPRIAPESELQDKSERSYFIDTMRLEPGEVFVSPVELNVEHGKVEEPYRPVVRLATPINDATGERRGIVVLNAHGEHFMRVFERSTEESGIQRMVVSSDGYWVQQRAEAESGVVRDHGRSFQQSFPDVWPQLLASPEGRIESREGLFYFDTITPPASASSPEGEAQELPTWIFISLVPRQLLSDMAIQIATPLLVIATPLFFAVVVIGSLVAAALHRRDEALHSLSEVRSAMMAAALDGIVVMDETGTMVEFNPSARRIFGYTLEETRGKLVADLIIPPDTRETHRLGLERYLATGEGRIIDKHIDELTAIRKSGEEFPIELTVCSPVRVAGKRLFIGFLRDLSEPDGGGNEYGDEKEP